MVMDSEVSKSCRQVGTHHVPSCTQSKEDVFPAKSLETCLVQWVLVASGSPTPLWPPECRVQQLA